MAYLPVINAGPLAIVAESNDHAGCSGDYTYIIAQSWYLSYNIMRLGRARKTCQGAISFHMEAEVILSGQRALCRRLIKPSAKRRMTK